MKKREPSPASGQIIGTFRKDSISSADNAAREPTTLTHKQGTTTLGYLTYSYDAAGNRLKTGGTFARSNIPPALASASYNANNQQTAFGTTTETYDLNSNLATSTEAGVTTTYSWNARNQLTGISRTGLTASFTYDSFGRRTGKTINGTTTNFVYDGLNSIQEKNGGTVTANLLTGLGIDEFFTRTDSVGVRALLPDALGSTIALGDGTGTLQTQYTYEPFGFVSQTGAASTNSYKYTGREDDGTGLSYYRARYYQPRLQRFISEDPIGFLGGSVNLYGYVDNSPVRWNDPLGLEKGRKPNPVCLTLRAAVIVSCKAPTSCNASDPCEVLRIKITLKRFCIVGQQNLTKYCFPDSPSHDQRIEDELRGIKRCQGFLQANKQCTPGC